MDPEKLSTNSSTADPLMALKTTVAQAELRGWQTSELLSTEQRGLPEGLSSARPMLPTGRCRANRHRTEHRPGRHGCSNIPPPAHQLARSLQKPKIPRLQTRSSTGAKHLMLRSNIQETAMVNNYQLKLVRRVELGQ